MGLTEAAMQPEVVIMSAIEAVLVLFSAWLVRANLSRRGILDSAAPPTP